MPFKAIVKNARIIESCLKSLKLPIKALNYYCPQTKFKKVMFYRCLSVHRGAWCTPPRTRSRHPPRTKGRHPPGQTPLPPWTEADTPWTDTPLLDTMGYGQQGAVRILLECILVRNICSFIRFKRVQNQPPLFIFWIHY